jgi:hypothetical protein
MKSSALKNTRNLNDTSLLAGILLATASFGYSASTSTSYSSIVTVSENANSFTSSLSGTSLFDFNALATSYETVRDHLQAHLSQAPCPQPHGGRPAVSWGRSHRMNTIEACPWDIPQLRELLISAETISSLNNAAVAGNPAQR